MNTEPRQSAVRRVVNVAFFTALLAFFIPYVRSVDFDSLHEISVSAPLILLATLVALAVPFWGVFIWRTILVDLGAEFTQARQLTYVYAKSWLGRYLPGKVTWILGKIYFASHHGVGKKQLTVSATLEAALQIVITLNLSVLCLLASNGFGVLEQDVRIYLVIAAAGATLILYPRIFNFALGLLYRLVRRRAFDTPITWRTVFTGGWLYGITFMLSGSSYYIFLLGLYPELDRTLFIYVVGAFNLAGIIGVLAFFTPSGLGVREAVQLVLLTVIMPPDLALVVTAVSRLWLTGVDVLFFGLAYGWNAALPRRRAAGSASSPPVG